MNRLEIVRTDPNNGYVVRLDNFFKRIKVTETTTYRSCLAYVMEHQEEATVYKVARILSRKNARRQLYERFLARDQKEAVDIFYKHYVPMAKDFKLQLCTGDWKVICETAVSDDNNNAMIFHL